MKILYFIHTDWKWIKQRSQFIAEQLSGMSDTSVFIFYKYQLFGRFRLIKNSTIAPSVFPSFLLPFKLRTIKVLEFADRIINGCIMLVVTTYLKPDIIVVTHPLLFRYFFLKIPIVFDLHDDNANFYQNGALKNLIESENDFILKNAHGVIFSSYFLKTKFESKLKQKSLHTVIRNGHSNSKLLNLSEISNKKEVAKYFNIYYFGTVSEWFDFNLIRILVKHFQYIKFTIIGPSDVELPIIDRVTYIGPMGHDELMNFSKSADAFIMPFYISPLIEGVDPVKLYEYISFACPILAPYYPEISRFGEYVYLYHTSDEALTYLNNIINNENLQIDMTKRIEFLAQSHWSSRATSMRSFLQEVIDLNET